MIEYIDPFIGVDDPGRCLCGPYLPYSLVRLGPDTAFPQQSNGYESHRSIIRFSHTHVSGTGGGGRYGNIGVTPFVGPPRPALDPYLKEDETARAGYYAVTLLPAGIRAELTCTPRVGVHRYHFPPGLDAYLRIDAGAVIQVAQGGETPGEDTGLSTGGFVEFISDHEIVGRGDFRGGWGHNFPYSVYFYAVFDAPFQDRMVANEGDPLAETCMHGPDVKAIAGFGQTGVVNLRVGISYASIAKAHASVRRETAGQDFEALCAMAARVWEQALGRIRVEGGSLEQKTLFYTLFYRLLCMPSDLGTNDEFTQWETDRRHFTDFYCLWDSVRNANSLLGLFDPQLEVDLLNCLLDIAGHTGWLPDAWIAGHSAYIQGGSSADILFCEAGLKGLPGIDYPAALRQMRKNGEVESPDPRLYGRFLPEYRDLGYLSTNIKKNCVSRHMEYAYQDWCIGALAQHLGQAQVARVYIESSQKIWNLWRQELESFAPRSADGQWVDPFDPAACLPDSWNDPYFYEGTGLQWSFNVFHDFEGLIRRCGGPAGFVQRLDEFFERGYYHSKETMLHIPYLYSYAGRPDRTAVQVRRCMEQYFRAARDGLSDNEDMGCQSAWYMGSALGLYPIMGQDVYLLSAPLFRQAEIELGASGKRLVIEAPTAGTECGYILSASLNGKPLDRAWIRHREIASGAVLRLELGQRPGEWGRRVPPPSPLRGCP